jgi:transposase InsO family protein
MSKARVVVLEVVSGHLTVTEAAWVYGLSRQHLYRLLNRYRQGGLEAVDPRSRRPASNPRAVSDEVIITVVTLRIQLVADGLDAGPVTLQWHLAQQGLPVPSTSTIRRILDHHGLITPQPRKRPKSSSIRFQAAQPNQCWQSDFTHWTLADGTDVEILNWLDDHSRYLLYCTACRRVSGPDIVASFTHTAATYGLPACTLTDNGSVYTSRFTHGHNDFERLIASLGVTQKNGHPGHPQTQGKIERFHQPLKRWLTPRPRPTDSTNSKPYSTSSASATTPPDPTAPCPNAAHRPRPTPHYPKPAPAARPPNTSASAMTPSTNSANSPCATAAACTTSASDAPTPTPQSSSWSPPTPSPSSAKPATNSSPATTSTPTTTTGATNKKTRPIAGESATDEGLWI